MSTLTIVGFDETCTCAHNGRPLNIRVKRAESGTINADCYVRLMARDRRRFNGSGKLGAACILEHAVIVAKREGYMRRHGMALHYSTFAAEAAVQ